MRSGDRFYSLFLFLAFSAMGACSNNASSPSLNQGTPIIGAGGVSGASAASGTGISVVAGGGGAVVIAGNGSTIGGSGGVGKVTGAGGKSGTGATSVGAGGQSTAGAGGTVVVQRGDCGKNLLPVPEDPSARGPSDVGIKTVKIGRLTVSIFYPAKAGSTAGKPEAMFDQSDWTPPQERLKTAAQNKAPYTAVGGHIYRDVPIDDLHGPYPVVIYIHGTVSIRDAHVTIHSLWASRGFVVVAADYPGLFFTDMINSGCGYPQTGVQDVPGDVDAQIAALKSPSGDLSFLAGHVDMTRLGISGHSQGGCITAQLAAVPNVQIVIPMDSSTAVVPSESLKSVMYIGGMADTVISYDGIAIGSIVCQNFAVNQVTGYEGSPGQPDVVKRIVGITGGGHLVALDVCVKNSSGKLSYEQGIEDGVCGITSAAIIGLPALFDCGVAGFDMKAGLKAVGYATTAALEETLHCKDRTAAFANMTKNIPLIGDFRHDP
jgi:hypothetical protein